MGDNIFYHGVDFVFFHGLDFVPSFIVSSAVVFYLTLLRNASTSGKMDFGGSYWEADGMAGNQSSAVRGLSSAFLPWRKRQDGFSFQMYLCHLSHFAS